MNQQIDKIAYDEEFRVCDFSTVLLAADVVTGTPTVIVTDSTGADVSAAMISNVAISADLKGVKYKLKGGTAGSKYTLKVRIDTQSLQKFEEPFTVCVS